MSPEQLRSSSHVDPRTDIWSLGVTLHELITGKLPFAGTDLPQLCTSVLASEPARLTAILPEASPLLEAILLRCLEKDPDLRFDNVAELAEELVPFGRPATAARAARIKEVMRRGADSVRRPARMPVASESRIAAPKALAGGDAPAATDVTAVSIRNATIPPRRKAALARTRCARVRCSARDRALRSPVAGHGARGNAAAESPGGRARPIPG